jgi:hypothetical protein
VSAPREAAARLAGPAALGAAFVALALSSFGRWTDPLIDFGAELYLPWRLLEGDRLYADIAYRNGPLSPHLNALWFRLFGVSLRTLIACNLALLALLCALAWRILRGTDPLARSAAILVLLVGFGFGNYTEIANYNWVTPNQHAQTHGVLLGFATIAALGSALGSGRARSWAAAGSCLGLAFLTKAELAVPAGAAAAVAWGLELLGARASGRERRARLAAFAAGACAPPALAAALLALQLPAGVAFEGVLGNWRYLGPALLSDRFYREGAGLDAPLHHAAEALRVAGAIALALAATLALDRMLARRAPRWLPACVGVATGLALVAARQRIPWLELARALPATSLAAAAALAAAWWRRREDAAARAALAAPLVGAVYALALLGKMLLAARFEHYGFTLAMPATLLLVASSTSGLPRLAARWGGGRTARALALAFVVALVAGLWSQSRAGYARKTWWVGPPADAIRVEPERGPGLERLLGALDDLPRGATLLALPEGLSLNYWSRRRNPCRYWLFLPTELEAAGGEAVVLEELRAHPPDFVALVDRPHHEFGVGRFGIDRRNGRRIGDWVRAHYRRVEAVGRPRVTLLRRRDLR